MAFVIVHVLITLVLPAAEAERIFNMFSFIPALFSGQNSTSMSVFTFLSPISYMFLHGGWVHLIFNAIMTVAFGTLIEREYGAKITAILFFGGGLAGAAVFFVLYSGQAVQLVGASAGLSAFFGVAILRMADQMRMADVQARLSPMTMILLWTAIMVVTGMMGGNVAWVSHLAGFFFGIGLYSLMRRGYIRL